MNKVLDKEIPFNYFLIMFEREMQKRTLEKLVANKLVDQDDEEDLFEIMFFADRSLNEAEKITITEEAFYEVLVNYLSLSENTELTTLPKKSIDLCALILNTLEETPYKQSILMSIQFIISRYLEVLKKGSPNLCSSQTEDKKQSFVITYDKKHRINEFESINMSLEEQDETMVNVLKLILDNKEPNLPNVEIVERKDI